jgi:hypothetical protein
MIMNWGMPLMFALGAGWGVGCSRLWEMTTPGVAIPIILASLLLAFIVPRIG